MSSYTPINKPIVFDKKFDHFKLSPGKFTVTVEISSDLYKTLEKDGLLLGELNEIAQECYDKYVVGVMNNTLSKADAVFEIATEKGATRDFFNAQIAGLNKTLENNVNVAAKACEQALLKRCAEFIKTKKEYTKYKFKIGLKISMTVASLAASVGSLASTPFSMGAGTVISIYGIAKSAVNLAQQIAIACEEAETTLGVVKHAATKLGEGLRQSVERRKMAEALLQHPAMLKSLQQIGPDETAKAMYSKQIIKYCFASEKKLAAALKSGEITKGGLNASSAGREVLATIGSWALGATLPSIKFLGENWDTLQSKTKGIEVKAHDFAIKLNELLDKQEKLDNDFNAALAKCKMTGTKDEARLRGNYQKYINASRADVMAKIDKTSQAYNRFKKVNRSVSVLTKQVEIIISLRSGWFDKLELALSGVDLLLNFASADAKSFTGFGKFMEDVGAGLLQTSAEFAIDKVIDKITG